MMADAVQAALDALVEIVENPNRDPDVRIRAAGVIFDYWQAQERNALPA